MTSMRGQGLSILLALATGAAAFCLSDTVLAQRSTSANLLPRNPPLPPKRPDFPAERSEAPKPQEPQESDAEAAAGPSACIALLQKHGADFEPAPTQKDAEDSCKIDEPVLWKGVTAPGRAKISLDAAVTVRCALAVQLTLWVRDDLAPITERFGHRLRRLVGVGGQACRGRNRQAGARISEHATGNAFDVRKLEAHGGLVIDIMQDRDPARRAMRDEIRTSTCARFTTVLGSGSDDFHEDHLHVDLQERRGGYRLCQWDVR